jgi:predicted nuclease with TOPRIM domain
MAHDAEYAQREFRKRKEQQRDDLHEALEEIRALRDTVTRLEQKVTALREDVQELKGEKA